MAFMPRKARRSKSKLRLAICGPSGSGKTLSSLLVAYGLTGDWEKIGFIDTEAGSGEQYVGRDVAGVRIGEYDYYRIDPPFTVLKYLEAINGFAAMGKECVIVDSLSHAWAGTGGLLDKQGRIADSSKAGNSYAAWRQVTPEHNALVDAMLQNRAHVIGTMRSKQDYMQEKDEKGKTTIRKVGMAPVQRDGMEYEFTVVLDVEINHFASATKDRTGLLDGLFFTPSPKTGEDLLEWLNTGVDAVHPKDKAIQAIKDSSDMAALKFAFDSAVEYGKAAKDAAFLDLVSAAKDEAKMRLGTPKQAVDEALAGDDLSEPETLEARINGKPTGYDGKGMFIDRARASNA